MIINNYILIFSLLDKMILLFFVKQCWGTINLINELSMEDDENHPFIMPLIKNIYRIQDNNYTFSKILINYSKTRTERVTLSNL